MELLIFPVFNFTKTKQHQRGTSVNTEPCLGFIVLLTDGVVLSLSCVAQENSQDLTQTLGETSVVCRGKKVLWQVAVQRKVGRPVASCGCYLVSADCAVPTCGSCRSTLEEEKGPSFQPSGSEVRKQHREQRRKSDAVQWSHPRVFPPFIFLSYSESESLIPQYPCGLEHIFFSSVSLYPTYLPSLTA